MKKHFTDLVTLEDLKAELREATGASVDGAPLVDAAPPRPHGFLVGLRALGGFWFALLAVGGIGFALLEWLGPPRAAVSPGNPATPPASSPAAAAPPIAAAPVAAAARADEPQPGPQPEAAPSKVAAVEPAPPPAVRTLPPPDDAPSAAIAQRVPDAVESAKPASAPQPKPAAPAAPPQAGKGLILHYLSGSPEAEAAAKRLAARIGGRVELRPERTAPGSSLVRYFYGEDHASARAAAQALGDMGYFWNVQSAPSQSSPGRGVIELWLAAP